MTLYKENPKDSKSKLIDLINEFSEVARYKINIQKVFTIHYTNNEILERECKKKKQYVLKLLPPPKKRKINLTGVKDLYIENYKIGFFTS